MGLCGRNLLLEVSSGRSLQQATGESLMAAYAANAVCRRTNRFWTGRF